MNRIYQGKVTKVEIANPDKHSPRILSASIPFSASDGEKVAKPDEVSAPKDVRCRNQNPWKPFDTDPRRIGSNGSPHAHQPRNTPTTRNCLATKEHKEHK